MKRTLLLLTAAILTFVLLSCSSGYDEVYPEVVGTWELLYNSADMPTISPAQAAYRDGTGYYEFKQNGTALVPVDADEDGSMRSVKCELTSTTTEIKVSYNGINLISGKFVRNGKKLTVTNESTGNTFIFVKVDS